MNKTTAPVLDPGRGRIKTDYLWAPARDDRGLGGEEPLGVVFTYHPSLAGAHAEQQSRSLPCEKYGQPDRLWLVVTHGSSDFFVRG